MDPTRFYLYSKIFRMEVSHESNPFHHFSFPLSRSATCSYGEICPLLLSGMGRYDNVRRRVEKTLLQIKNI
jgi:hypothetical protein